MRHGGCHYNRCEFYHISRCCQALAVAHIGQIEFGDPPVPYSWRHPDGLNKISLSHYFNKTSPAVERSEGFNGALDCNVVYCKLLLLI
jgi:hypothetical protein